MRKLGKSDFAPMVNLKKMIDIPVDCVYVKTEMFQPKDPNEDKVPLHTFHNIEDSEKEFVIFGFGLMNYHIMGKEGDPDAPPLEAKTPIRLVYKGLKKGEITLKTGKKIKKDLHDLDIFVIDEEVKNGKIKETTMDLCFS